MPVTLRGQRVKAYFQAQPLITPTTAAYGKRC